MDRSSTTLRACAPLAAVVTLLLAGCGEDPPPDHHSEPRPNIYVYGETIKFGFGGDAHRFKGDGWAQVEQPYTWMKGLGAWMQLRVQATDQPLTLRMKLKGMTSAPELPFQPVHVSVNGRKIAVWKVSAAPRDYTAVIPRELVMPPSGTQNWAGYTTHLILDFYTPKSASPSRLNLSRDPRRLGVCVWEATITEGFDPAADNSELATVPETPDGSPYTLGVRITFGSGGNSSRYKLEGWYNAEATFTWIGRRPAVLGFQIEPREQPLHLTVVLAALVKPPKLTTQPTELLVNGAKLATWQVGARRQEFTAAIPPELAATGTLRIELAAPNAISPNSLQLSHDLRPLGVQVHMLQIDEAP